MLEAGPDHAAAASHPALGTQPQSMFMHAPAPGEETPLCLKLNLDNILHPAHTTTIYSCAALLHCISL